MLFSPCAGHTAQCYYPQKPLCTPPSPWKKNLWQLWLAASYFCWLFSQAKWGCSWWLIHHPPAKIHSYLSSSLDLEQVIFAPTWKLPAGSRWPSPVCTHCPPLGLPRALEQSSPSHCCKGQPACGTARCQWYPGKKALQNPETFRIFRLNRVKAAAAARTCTARCTSHTALKAKDAWPPPQEKSSFLKGLLSFPPVWCWKAHRRKGPKIFSIALHPSLCPQG